MRTSTSFIFCLMFPLIMFTAALADIPRLITYQGQLTDDTGNPVADGEWTILFYIYADSLLGDPLWEESQSVPVKGGLFDVQLGLNQSLPDSAFKWYPDLFLAMDVEGFGELDPRTRLTSTAFSFHALVADTAGYAANVNWYLEDNVLRTNQQWGLARGGPDNHILGPFKNTIVNLGHHSTAGAGYMVDNITISGGAYHHAQDGASTICGGYADTVTGGGSTIAGGSRNTLSGNNSWMGGSFYSKNAGNYCSILGGHYDTISAGVYGSYLFGLRSKLTTDSTFMVDLPYIRFGDETNGYVFPSTDGAAAQTLVTNGSGQLHWETAAGSGGGWVDDGAVVRLQTSTDKVGIGTSSPGERLVVGRNLGSFEGDFIEVGNNAFESYSGFMAGEDGSNRGWLFWDNDGNFLNMGTRANGVAYNNTVVIRNDMVGIDTDWPTATLHVNGEMKGFVYGEDEIAVYAEANGLHGHGVHGVTTNGGVGVYGHGNSIRGIGVKGVSELGMGAGVVGVGDGSNGWGVAGYASGSDGRAVYGKSEYDDAIGMYSEATGLRGKAFYGKANQDGGIGLEVEALGSTGVGLIARCGAPTGLAAKFFGNVNIHSKDDGSLIMQLGEGLDYAEGFDVSSPDEISPGMVLSIDPDNPGELTICGEAYDTKVAGIVAGANGLGSGVRLGAGGFDLDVALAGRVYCNVDASQEGIEPGDLLTTSSLPGYAMKASDDARTHGAILGKAMQPLEKGQTGQILVLVTLQ